MICRLKNEAGLLIDDNYLYEEFGIPKPENYDRLKAEEEAQRTKKNDDNPKGAPEEKSKETEEDPEAVEQESKTAQKSSAKGRRITDRLIGFFVPAPESAGADSDW